MGGNGIDWSRAVHILGGAVDGAVRPAASVSTFPSLYQCDSNAL